MTRTSLRLVRNRLVNRLAARKKRKLAKSLAVTDRMIDVFSQKAQTARAQLEAALPIRGRRHILTRLDGRGTDGSSSAVRVFYRDLETWGLSPIGQIGLLPKWAAYQAAKKTLELYQNHKQRLDSNAKRPRSTRGTGFLRYWTTSKAARQRLARKNGKAVENK